MFSCELKNIKAHVIVGLFDFERQQHQLLNLNIKYWYEAPNDAETDTLIESPDYVSVADTLLEHVKSGQFQLLECLLQSSIQYIFSQYPQINKIDLSVNKPAAYPNSQGPTIQLSLSK